MIDPSFLGLIQNAALLLALVLVFDLSALRWSLGQRKAERVLIGFVLGGIGMVVMLTPWVLVPGIVFDTRSILLGVSGLFFGVIPTLIAMVLTAALRYYQGGAGVVTGISVILATGSIGILWRQRRLNSLADITWAEFYLFGLILHLVMLGLMFTLPWQTALQVVSAISLPVLTIYPLGTMLLGIIMSNRIRRENLADKIHEDEIRFQIVADNTYDWEYWLSKEGKFIYCSPSCLNLTGHTQAEFFRDPTLFRQIIHPDDQSIYTIHRSTVSAHRSEEIEFRILLPDGSVRWVGHVCVPLFDKSGNFIGTRGSNRDITKRKLAEEKEQAAHAESQRLLLATDQSRRALLSLIEDQKRAEEQIRCLNLELEQRVLKRTMQLEETNKELEAFSYSVSHDLRAPLRVLDGFSSVLLTNHAGQLDAEGKHYLNRIQEASRRMGLLIDDLLSLSRVTRSDFMPQPVDLSALAHAIVEGLRLQNPNRQVEVTIAGNLVADGSLPLLKIVLENLLANAFKFTSHCERPAIEVGKLDQAGKPVFFVRDNGAGFDMAYADKLFAPFQRLHTTQEYPGTGIGLATVQRIVHRHGGKIWPEAAVNQGATFFFTLGGS